MSLSVLFTSCIVAVSAVKGVWDIFVNPRMKARRLHDLSRDELTRGIEKSRYYERVADSLAFLAITSLSVLAIWANAVDRQKPDPPGIVLEVRIGKVVQSKEGGNDERGTAGTGRACEGH